MSNTTLNTSASFCNTCRTIVTYLLSINDFINILQQKTLVKVMFRDCTNVLNDFFYYNTEGVDPLPIPNE